MFLDHIMAFRDYIGLLISISTAGAMFWGCSFEIQQIMMGELVTAAGGKYKFLTILNMVRKIRSVFQ